MNRCLFSFGAVLLAGSLAFAAQQTSKLSQSDQQFIQDLGQANLGEVQMGDLAQKKAADVSVKNFGAKMAQDHSKLQDQLKKFASQNSISLPSKPSMHDRDDLARIGRFSGTNFDQQYIDQMVRDHTKDVSDVKMKAQSAEDPQVKSLAQQILPTLEEHLRTAQNIQKQLNKPGTTSGGSSSGENPSMSH